MQEFVIKGKSPTKMIELFLARHGWERCEIGWILPGKYLVKNLQAAFQCQQTIFVRQKLDALPKKTNLSQFLENLDDSHGEEKCFKQTDPMSS